MKYNTLGNTDLRISALALGSMTWGQQNTAAEAFTQLDYALDQGINFIDTAELYAIPPKAETYGKTEEIIGQWLHQSGGRGQIVLASKAAGPGIWVGHIRGGPRLNRAHLQRALEASLRRLQTDYLDLYQIHWPSRHTNYFGKLGYEHWPDETPDSIEETLAALHEMVQQGKVRHIGISNETPWGVMQYLNIAEQQGWSRIRSIQNPYNLLNRTFEVGLAEMAIRENVGLLAYSPLGFGVLSGKYLAGKRPKGARMTLFGNYGRYSGETAQLATEAYVELAAQHGLSPVQLALAFVNAQPFVTANIIGATSLAQLRENIASIDVELSAELRDQINKIHLRWSNPAP